MNAKQLAILGLAARHRQAELEMLLSPEFPRVAASRSVVLTNYGDLIAKRGLSAMRRP